MAVYSACNLSESGPGSTQSSPYESGSSESGPSEPGPSECHLLYLHSKNDLVKIT